MNEKEQALVTALKSLADENAAIAAPPDVEWKVLAAFDARNTQARRSRWIPALTATAALAASLTIAAVWLHRPAPQSPQRETAFTAIPYVAPLAPYERAEVRRMDVPLAALAAAGLEVHGSATGPEVRADVLVGQDGRALAIRLVPNSI